MIWQIQISSPDLQIGIKPNLVSPTEASWGATTHPEIVAGIIEYLQEKGFAKIAILEGSWVGDKTTEAYELCGYQGAFRKISGSFLGYAEGHRCGQRLRRHGSENLQQCREN